MSNKAEIDKMLSSLGVPANLVGGTYLEEAVQCLIGRKNYVKQFCTVYTDIAEAHSVSWKSVERSMRYAISKAHARKTECFTDVFGCVKPSVSYFVCSTARLISAISNSKGEM